MAVKNSESPTLNHLSNNAKQWVRLAWIAFTVMAVTVFIISLPQIYRDTMTICDGEDCPFVSITSEEAARYEELNISYGQTVFVSIFIGVLYAIVFVGVGVFIFLSRPDEVMAVITAFTLVSAGIAGPVDYLQPDNIFWELGLRIIQGGGVWGVSAFLFAFPNGHFTPRWTRWIVYLLAPVVIIVGILVASDILLPDTLTSILLPLMIIGPASQVYRYFRVASPTERQQMKWVILALLLVMVFLGISGAITAIPSIIELASYYLGWLGFVIISFIPLSIMISVLRYGLWNIDFYINRSLVYGSLTILLGIIFVAVFFGLRAVFSSLLGTEQLGIELIVPTAVVVALFNPARKRIRHFVDRRIYGIKLDYAQVKESRRVAGEVSENTTTIGDYVMTDILGSGGMGEVYSGRDMNGQDVAIKVILNKFQQDSEIEQRFLREAQSTAKLDHPNIVKILSVGEDKGKLFIAMEYIRGQNWGAIFKTQGVKPLSEILPRLREIASALDYVHQNDIIHRDIKPGNIMIEEESGRAVLMDFGVAKITSNMTALTGTSQIIGSLDYISPEQIQGQENINHRADLYSFAIMTYQLLTGKLPFDKSNAGALVMAHLIQPPPDASEIDSSISPETADALIKGMAKDPFERYQSASEFVSALL